MRILLVSTYELGHQPLHLASPAAALAAAGHQVRCSDTAVDPWRNDLLDDIDALALSVPMHTAMRLALGIADSARAVRPDLPVCLYGLYAAMGADANLARGLVDRVIAGEYEPELVAWADELAAGRTPSGVAVALGRTRFTRPERAGLPTLDRYARLAVDDERRLAGYVEASHGCIHHCRHCPLPVVYDGRLRIVDPAVVVADVEAQVAAGARHITFGDPDFLNGPAHALRVVSAVHRRFPDLTFDCTTKVSHILRHADLWPELAGQGCLFVVSAFESVSDQILALLDKGHTAAEAVEAVTLLRGHGLEIRPSFLPFTPWTTLTDVAGLLDFVATHDLVGNVDPVQYTIRLLLPEGSLLLATPELFPHLGAYDQDRLAWTWSAADPAADRLQSELAALVERSTSAGDPLGATYQQIRDATRRALAAAGDHSSMGPDPALGAAGARPRLTESWFCCAEPTEEQLLRSRPGLPGHHG